MKSHTCIGKSSGKPLTEYESQRDAQEGADHARQAYGRKMAPYQCDTCGMWHLAAENRQTPSTKCPVCTGSDGKRKDTYRNESEAQRRADILRKEQGAELRVYACEKGHGWHLTKGYSGNFSSKKTSGKKSRR